MSDCTPCPSSEPPHTKRGINLLGLIALVISSSIGSGVFALSTDISAAAAPGPALIAWLITGIGFMGLATTFGRLSIVQPELDGIVAYARAGFGPFVGFVSGWGYWLSIWIGNVAFGVMLVTAIGYFYPPFAGELTVPGVVFISLLNWLIVALVNRGVEEASALNAIVMVCKLVPIFAFILAMLFVFSFDVFSADFWGTLANNLYGVSFENVNGTVIGAPGSIPTQIINCFMVMMWVFVGMEGASVLGHRAERKSDVSRATILGCTALLIIYVAASILPYGFLTREELMTLGSPSMPYIFEKVVGPWGGASSREAHHLHLRGLALLHHPRLRGHVRHGADEAAAEHVLPPQHLQRPHRVPHHHGSDDPNPVDRDAVLGEGLPVRLFAVHGIDCRQLDACRRLHAQARDRAASRAYRRYARGTSRRR